MFAASALVQGLVAGIVSLGILAVRAAMDGGSGVAFADLWTALIIGVAVGFVAYVFAELSVRRSRPGGRWGSASVVTAREAGRGPQSADSPERVRSGSGHMDRFDKFTDRARKVLTLAQDEAQRFNHNYIGTEHLLLGLVREGEGVAARVLENMNVELDRVRSATEFIIGRGDSPVVGEVGLTPRAKRVIELAIDEARRLGHNYIGTEHLLLGLVREGEGIAAGVLESLGVNLDKVRHEVIRVLATEQDPA
jgi:hypothetical protein